jgi:small nuclear ribonucleoprotein (snRNP)-like protein
MRTNYRGIALHHTVIVNLTTGAAFRGVLYEVRGDLLVLRNAQAIQEDAVVPIDGAVIIERAKVEFVQVISWQ